MSKSKEFKSLNLGIKGNNSGHGKPRKKGLDIYKEKSPSTDPPSEQSVACWIYFFSDMQEIGSLCLSQRYIFYSLSSI